MGCSSSSPKEEEKTAAAAEKQRQRDAANAAMNAPKLDPKDFMCTRLKDQTIVKEPGSINGQQFIIEECENCNIYLLDHTATVSIDECKNCRIFVGPCESSVFVRTSKQMKLVIAAQQLRTRECSDLDILLYVSAGQPVIESTSGVRLGCFDWNYFGLAAQFAKAGLDPWHSEWSNVHDFTASSGSVSWSYLDASLSGTDLLPPLSEAAPGGQLENLPGFVTPRTWGKRPLPFAQPARLMVAVAPGHADAVGLDLLEVWLAELLAAPAQAVLVRTRRVDFAKPPHKDRAAGIFTGQARKRQEKFVQRLGDAGGTLGLELACTQEALNNLLAKLQLAAEAHPGLVYVSEPAESQGPLESFFENVPVM